MNRPWAENRQLNGRASSRVTGDWSAHRRGGVVPEVPHALEWVSDAPQRPASCAAGAHMHENPVVRREYDLTRRVDRGVGRIHREVEEVSPRVGSLITFRPRGGARGAPVAAARRGMVRPGRTPVQPWLSGQIGEKLDSAPRSLSSVPHGAGSAHRLAGVGAGPLRIAAGAVRRRRSNSGARRERRSRGDGRARRAAILHTEGGGSGSAIPCANLSTKS